MKKNSLIQEAQIIEERWDKKKILIGVVILFLSGVGVVYGKYWYDQASAPKHLLSVQGTSTDAVSVDSPPTPTPGNQLFKLALPSSQDVSNSVNQQIQSLQDQVSQINVQELATTSPQIQSIIKQIEALPQIPGQTAKQACMQVCNNL